MAKNTYRESSVLWRTSEPRGDAPRATLVGARRAAREGLLWSGPKGTERAAHRLSFFGLCLFTILLYVRPNDLLPHSIGTLDLLLWSPIGLTPIDPHALAIVKTVAIVTLLAYVVAKLSKGERLTAWPIELRALLVIVGLGVLFMPIAAVPKDSYDELTDTFLKVVIIFVLLVNLLDTLPRLRTILRIVVLCGTGIAVGAIVTYAEGNFTAMANGVGVRIEGVVEGIFGNPNDLATALNLLIPIAVALAVLRRGWQRLLFAACAATLAAGVVVTFSRAGFLGLMAIAGFGLFKRLPSRPGTTLLATVALFGLLAVAAPGGYAGRLSTIFDSDADKTGSATQRLELLKRAASVASHHLVLGVGMGNFHVYSISELRAHNSYLEIAAELGLLGLVAYLVMIVAPVLGLRRIERETRPDAPAKRARLGAGLAIRGPGAPAPATAGLAQASRRELYVLSIAVQAAFLGYAVCSAFASIQYLWYLYYLVAYAIALRHIYARVSGGSPAVAPAGPKFGMLWPARALGAGRGRLWGLATFGRRTEEAAS